MNLTKAQIDIKKTAKTMSVSSNRPRSLVWESLGIFGATAESWIDNTKIPMLFREDRVFKTTADHASKCKQKKNYNLCNVE